MASSRYKKSTSIQNHSSNKADEAVQLFTDMMIERMTALKNQQWEKGWFNGTSFEGLPQNFSGRTYNGSNTFFLYMNTSFRGYSMPVYLTFEQAKKNNIKINKGEKSFPVLYWNLSIKDKKGNSIPFEDYKNLSKEEKEECYIKPFLKTYPVFNVDQTNFKEVKPEEYENLKKKFEIPEIKDSEGMYTHNALDNVVKNQTWICPVQSEQLSDEAYYSPSRDVVVLPMKAQFKKHDTEEEIYRDGMQFYSTMLHEMAHSTGHKDRLNRVGGIFGDPKYAKEELVAELTAAMIGNSMGFDSKITDNSAKYLDNWLGALKEDPKFIVSVMADVNKAADMILDKVDEQRLALGETPYLSKNMVAVENEYSLEPEFKPVNELIASEPAIQYRQKSTIEEYLDSLTNPNDITSGDHLLLPKAIQDKYNKYESAWEEAMSMRASGLCHPDDIKAQVDIMNDHFKLYRNDLENFLETNNIQKSNELHRDSLIASEPIHSYYGSLKPEEKEQLNHSLVEQYKGMKEKNPDAVLLFRVADNYMLLKEDTKIGKEILGLEISERNVPGIGILQYSEFKHSDLDIQLPKLPRAGIRVAICEQAFDPKLQRPKVKRGAKIDSSKEKSYKDLSSREQQKKQRELIKSFAGDEMIAILSSYNKKYHPETSKTDGKDTPVQSLLYSGLINYHQYFASNDPKYYADYCLSNQLSPDNASGKSLWRKTYENEMGFLSTGEILNQREQKVDKYNNMELKVLAVEAICQEIKNPTPFLKDLEKKGLITEQERTIIDELLNQPIIAENKEVAQLINPLKDLSVNRLNEMPVGTKITVTDLTSNYDIEIKTKQENGLWETAVGNEKGYTIIPHMEPKAIIGNFERIAVAEKEWDSKLQFTLSTPSLKQELNDKLINDNTMAKKKKPEEPVIEKKEEQVVSQKKNQKTEKVTSERQMRSQMKDANAEIFQINQGVQKGFEKDHFITLKYDIGHRERYFELKMDPKDYAKYKKSEISDSEITAIYFDKLLKKHNLIDLEKHMDIPRTEQIPDNIKHDQKKEEAVKQPREPQMVTVNGDKVTNAHVYNKKDNPDQWYFIAKINDKFLPSVAISQQEADDYRMNKNVPEMMEKYYPTKIMQRVPDTAFTIPNVVEGKTVEKFNVYKESVATHQDYGKYKFYAKVDGVHMNAVAKQEDLNAYFDKVKTPGQLVEKIFGEKLQLKSHYEQFKLPEGFDPKEIQTMKAKDSNKWLVYLKMGDAGNSKGKFLSYEDLMALKNGVANKEQIGAKYLSDEINKRVGTKQDNKVAETQKMKM